MPKVAAGTGDPALSRYNDTNTMLFATGSLARRIEQAECSLVVDFARAVRRRVGEEGVVIAEIAGGAAVMAGLDSPFNKTVGLGFAPIDEAALEIVEREFARRGAILRVELATLADPAVAGTLSRRGYVLSGFENVLGRPLDRAFASEPPFPGGIAVSRSMSGESRQWVEVVATGFLHPDSFDGPSAGESITQPVLQQLFEDTSGLPGVVRYLARRDSVVAGGASLRISNGVAQLSGAATLPQHRRQGVQRALLNERLADAAREGCDIAVVTTEPGSKSQQNVQGIGFELLYARAVLIKDPVA